MAEVSDHYRTLGVSKTADVAEIKRAYRKLAQTLHPDRGEGSPSQVGQFRAVQEAYEVLSDAAARRLYDQIALGHGSASEQGGQHVKGTASQTQVRSEVRLSFSQALDGGEAEVHLPDGRVAHVPIPRGVRSGMEVRLKPQGQGDHSVGEDVYVTFRVSPSLRFRREGNDLHIVEPITVIDALLGARRSIANAYGRNVNVSIPSGTQPGERFRLRGQGVKTADHCGDLYVEVRIVVPRSLTQEQRSALATCVEKLGIQ